MYKKAFMKAHPVEKMKLPSSRLNIFLLLPSAPPPYLSSLSHNKLLQSKPSNREKLWLFEILFRNEQTRANFTSRLMDALALICLFSQHGEKVIFSSIFFPHSTRRKAISQ
jgi:hypothetical protein